MDASDDGSPETWYDDPYEILLHGLESVEEGLRQLKEGNTRAKKLIYLVADTPGIELVQ